MKVQFIVPASVTGKQANNYVYSVTNIFQIWKFYRKAKKLKASSFYIFFPAVKKAEESAPALNTEKATQDAESI